jgi:hypothetical protein
VADLPACIGCVVQLGGVHLPHGLVLTATALRTAPTQQLAARRLLALLHEIVDQLLPASESNESTVVSPVDEPIVCSVWRELHVRRCAVHKCKWKHSHSTKDPHERARAGNACSGCVVVVVRVSDCLRWGVSSQRNVWRM